MASVKKRGDKWELTVKRKALREKPWYFTFDTEVEAREYGKKLEALLDGGVVPPGLIEEVKQYVTLSDLFKRYLTETHVAEGDQENLGVLSGRIGDVKIAVIDYRWAEAWITGMKREHNLSPPTIRHHVGALARCFDWAVRQGVAELATNPLRLLPKGYSMYSPADVAHVEATEGMRVKDAQERDRRLEPGEEERIRFIMDRGIPEGRERAFKLQWQAAIECMFDLAIETAMRMREIYRIEIDPLVLRLDEATVFLKKTKSTTRMRRVRQVPLSSTAVAAIRTYMQHVENQTRGMKGFKFDNGCLFPWWDGETWGDNAAEKAYLRTITTTLSQQYARIFEAAGCHDLTFHDLRHEATSRLFERTTLSEFEIMKITGHSSIKMLARYGNLRGSNLASKLW